MSTVGSLAVQRRNSIILQGKPSSRLLESFRILRTNLSFLSVDRTLRTFVMTSSVPDEGKSTVAINLAISLAQSGKCVLLIDADLRRPTIHKRLGIENVGGLSLRLLDQRESGDLARVPELPNLLVLTAGPKPPNPTELLGSVRMNDLIASLLAHAPKRGVNEG